jgi:hypothetical protein
MYDDHPTRRRNVGRPKKRWKDLQPYRWKKPGTAYKRLLLMMVTKCKNLLLEKRMYLLRYCFQACHVVYSNIYKSTEISVKTTASSGIAYHCTYLQTAWRRIPEAINFITTTVKA